MTEYIKKDEVLFVVAADLEMSDETRIAIDKIAKIISDIAPSSVVSRDAFNFLLRENDELRKKRVVSTGVWINDDGCMAFCSECYGMGCGSRYCPNCGARMENYDNDEVENA